MVPAIEIPLELKEMGQINLHLPDTTGDAVPAAAEPLGELKDFIFQNST